MVASQTSADKPEAETPVDFDAIVIGAGVAGLYQLYRLRELGLTVRVFEDGTNVGALGYREPLPGRAVRSWKAGLTATPFRGNCWKNGTGRSTSRASPKPSAI